MMIALTVHWKGGNVPLKLAVNVALMAAPVTKTEIFTLWDFFSTERFKSILYR